mmetsp:Transcript_79067/g.206234  ORF Transcript_79067/g.206234 Transcript_79067/m.206234 type:complete len:574 (+) Transcript_79067:127-1848(+)
MVEPQPPEFAPESRASDQHEGDSPFSIGKYSVAYDDDSQRDMLESVGSVGCESPSRTQVPIATPGPKLFHTLERYPDHIPSSSVFGDSRRLPQRDMPREDTQNSATTTSIDVDTLRWGVAGRPLDLLLSDPHGIVVKPGGAAGDAASREVTWSSGIDTAVPQPGPQFPRSRSGGSAARMSTSSLVLSMRDGGGGGVTFGPSAGGAPRHFGASHRRAAEVDGSGGGGGVGQGPPIRSPSRASSSSYCGLTHSEEKQTFQLDPEEEEWDTRQQQTGAAGRLVVYDVGDRPREDLTLRGGGAHHRIMVAAVTDGGKAAAAGVKAGDVLVSINGFKEFKGQSADAVHVTLRAPLTLVFLGFVGKLQAEVRLTNADHVCGISYRREVLRGSFEAPVQVCEESIFNAGLASLFLTVSHPAGDAASNRDAAHQPLFELQNNEAKGLIRRALRRVEPQEAMSGASTIAQEVQQQPSLTSAPHLWSNPPQPAYGPGFLGPAALGPFIGRLAMSDDGSPASEAAAAAVAAALASEVKDGPEAARQPPLAAGDRWPWPMLSSMPITARDQHLGFDPNQRLSSNV